MSDARVRVSIGSLAIELPPGARLTSNARRQLLADVQGELARRFEAEAEGNRLPTQATHQALRITARDLSLNRGLAARIADAIHQGLTQ